MSFVPDIALEKLKSSSKIDLVGIRDLKIPIHLDGKKKAIGEISILVSLDDKKQKGIHMSRLYSLLHSHFLDKSLSFTNLKETLKEAIKSQKGLSSKGRVRVKAQYPEMRKSLVSKKEGWRVYPFSFEVTKKKDFEFVVQAKVLYSSTCPCSSSLSRQLIIEDFEKKMKTKKTLTKKDFLKFLNEEEIVGATPHSQKSKALLKIKLKPSTIKDFSLISLIDKVEKALGTPVQTQVKREDEAQFARLNARNLMFCEDAVRKLGELFKKEKNFLDYKIKVKHFESLHPFTVESRISKGQEWQS